MPNICIIGDSWGCGEWGLDSNFGYSVTHHGIEQYLRYPAIDGPDINSCHVVNVSTPGASNIKALIRANAQFKIQEFDYVFWFITDPLRQLHTFNYDELVDITYDKLLELQSLFLTDSLKLANSFNKKIYCIGGAFKITKEVINQYENLVCYIPSLSEWLCPNYTHPCVWQSNWLDYIERKLTLEALDRLVIDKQIQDSLDHDSRFEKYFKPDGSHPNRFSHKLLYDKIVKDFKI